MNRFVEKISELLPELERRGSVYLFALGEREDVNRWDIILSASWSDANFTAAVRVVADWLRGRLDPSEIGMLARVSIIPSDSPDVAEVPASLEAVAPGEAKLIQVSLEDSDIRRMYVFKAMRPVNNEHPVATNGISSLT